MPVKKKKDALAPAGKRSRHGIYSWVNSRRLPKGRAFAKTRYELGQLRTAMIDRRGGEGKITPEELILVDSVIEALGVQKLLGLYVKKHGLLDEQAAKAGRLELTPIFSKHWINYAAAVRQGLLALNTIKDGREVDDGPTLAEIIRESDARDAAAAAGAGNQSGEGSIEAPRGSQSVPEAKGGPSEGDSDHEDDYL